MADGWRACRVVGGLVACPVIAVPTASATASLGLAARTMLNCARRADQIALTTDSGGGGFADRHVSPNCYHLKMVLAVGSS